MYQINNTDRGDIERAILWQYDQAANLIGIINTFKQFFDVGVTAFWDNFLTQLRLSDIVADENLSDFGLAVWGKAIGVPRLTYVDNNNAVQSISKGLYRKILIARLKLSIRAGTLKDYADFITSIFGEGVAKIVDNGKMALKIEAVDPNLDDLEYKALLANPDAWVLYPAGVKSDEHSNSNMFGFDGQEPVPGEGDPNIGTLDNSSFNWRLTVGGVWK